ncbi:MAG TPA: hypothetical protein VIL33_07475, partial [Rhodothermia bacterium]
MVHPDHQYDPTIIPQRIKPLLLEECDAVFGSRMLGGRPIEGGMPKWKYFANLFLTMIENATFYIFLSEYHSGFRAYSRKYLETVNVEANSDDFVFDTEIIAQGVAKNLLIREIPIQTLYFPEASQIRFWRSTRYGFAILKTMASFTRRRSTRTGSFAMALSSRATRREAPRSRGTLFERSRAPLRSRNQLRFLDASRARNERRSAISTPLRMNIVRERPRSLVPPSRTPLVMTRWSVVGAARCGRPASWRSER